MQADTLIKVSENNAWLSDLSETFVASIAAALNSDRIPCVLWGHYLLNIHGVPSIIVVGCLDHDTFRSRANLTVN
jgi:hypothetical protein